MIHTPTVRAHQEPENKNATQGTRRRMFRENSFGTIVPHIERRIAQGTVASLCPVAGLGLLRATPNAKINYSAYYSTCDYLR